MIITDITNIGDPQIILYEGKYYCYLTGSDRGNEGFHVFVSDDLVNWTNAGLCFEAISYWGDSKFWAPEVIYHGGKFVMHYTASSRELKSLRVGVAVSDSPTGPFVDVYNAPMFDFGYAAIDASALVCEHGNFLYYSKDCSENVIDGVHVSQIYCVELDDTLTKVISDPVLISTPEEDYELLSLGNPGIKTLWNEGPNVIKFGRKYLMNYSTNCYATNDYAICLSYAEHPMGPFVKAKCNPVLSRRGDLFGSGHNAFFYSKDGELMTAFHIQTNPDKPSGNRRVVLGKVLLEELNGEIAERIE